MRRALMLFAVAACQHAPPELLDARQKLETAEPSADLTTARAAVDAANREVMRSGASDRALDLAYIAGRRVEMANARARTAQHREQLAALEAEAAKLLAQERRDIEAQAAGLPPVPTTAKPWVEVAISPQVPKPAPLDALTSFARVKENAEGTNITIPARLVFVEGQPALTAEARQRLDQVAEVLKVRAERVSIGVHTDGGPRGANVALSKKRAKAVVDYLVGRGLRRDRFESHGFADTQPLVDDSTPENRELNQRLEIVLRAPPVS